MRLSNSFVRRLTTAPAGHLMVRWRSAFLAAAVTVASSVWAILICLPAHAQSFPDRPIKIVVPFPPGGSSDIVARAMAEGAAEALGQSVIVENVPGAGGNVGTARVGKSLADGYTLVQCTIGTCSINTSLYANAGSTPRSRAMKFGLRYCNTGRFVDPAQAVALAQAGEAAGFESMWTVEHTVVPGGYGSAYPYADSGKMAGGNDVVKIKPLP